MLYLILSIMSNTLTHHLCKSLHVLKLRVGVNDEKSTDGENELAFTSIEPIIFLANN